MRRHTIPERLPPGLRAFRERREREAMARGRAPATRFVIALAALEVQRRAAGRRGAG